MRMHGPQIQSGYFQREKNALFLPGIEPQFISLQQLQYWLHYHVSHNDPVNHMGK